MVNKVTSVRNRLAGIVLYDVLQTGCRYMSSADLQFEARLLGLAGDATVLDLSRELRRRGLDDYSAGRSVGWANA